MNVKGTKKKNQVVKANIQCHLVKTLSRQPLAEQGI